MTKFEPSGAWRKSMTGKQFKVILKQLGFTYSDAAKFVGKTPRTIQIYASNGVREIAVVVPLRMELNRRSLEKKFASLENDPRWLNI